MAGIVRVRTMGKRVNEDEAFIVVGGRHGDVYVTGLFRATRDLDLDALESEFAALGPDVTERPDVAMGLESAFGMPGCMRGDAVQATNFQAWLIARGDVERMPHKTYVLDVIERRNDPAWDFDNELREVVVPGRTPTP